jgi:hypothetical protein
MDTMTGSVLAASHSPEGESVGESEVGNRCEEPLWPNGPPPRGPRFIHDYGSSTPAVPLASDAYDTSPAWTRHRSGNSIQLQRIGDYSPPSKKLRLGADHYSPAKASSATASRAPQTTSWDDQGLGSPHESRQRSSSPQIRPLGKRKVSSSGRVHDIWRPTRVHERETVGYDSWRPSRNPDQETMEYNSWRQTKSPEREFQSRRPALEKTSDQSPQLDEHDESVDPEVTLTFTGSPTSNSAAVNAIADNTQPPKSRGGQQLGNKTKSPKDLLKQDANEVAETMSAENEDTRAIPTPGPLLIMSTIRADFRERTALHSPRAQPVNGVLPSTSLDCSRIAQPRSEVDDMRSIKSTGTSVIGISMSTTSSAPLATHKHKCRSCRRVELISDLLTRCVSCHRHYHPRCLLPITLGDEACLVCKRCRGSTQVNESPEKTGGLRTHLLARKANVPSERGDRINLRKGTSVQSDPFADLSTNRDQRLVRERASNSPYTPSANSSSEQPSGDVVKVLAKRAGSNPGLKKLLELVASHAATEEQIAAFNYLVQSLKREVERPKCDSDTSAVEGYKLDNFSVKGSREDYDMPTIPATEKGGEVYSKPDIEKQSVVSQPNRDMSNTLKAEANASLVPVSAPPESKAINEISTIGASPNYRVENPNDKGRPIAARSYSLPCCSPETGLDPLVTSLGPEATSEDTKGTQQTKLDNAFPIPTQTPAAKGRKLVACKACRKRKVRRDACPNGERQYRQLTSVIALH